MLETRVQSQPHTAGLRATSHLSASFFPPIKLSISNFFFLRLFHEAYHSQLFNKCPLSPVFLVIASKANGRVYYSHFPGEEAEDQKPHLPHRLALWPRLPVSWSMTCELGTSPLLVGHTHDGCLGSIWSERALPSV